MRHIATVLLITSATGYLPGAVPLRWTVETSRVQPASFEAYQGETLELEAALQSYGKPIAIDPLCATICAGRSVMPPSAWNRR